jgi:ABC-type lipoprotein release transport system permease subunit
MGTLWKIALRNTVRHARRTIITAVVMMAGISVFILFDSMIAGMDRMAVDNMADYTQSSMKIRNPDYVRDIQALPLDKGLAHPAETLAAVGAQGLAGAARLRFVARVSNYTDEIPVLADGVDPAADARVFKIAQSVTAGSWLSRAAPHSIVLGAELARELKLNVGDQVLVSAQTVNDVTNADEYTVAGLVSTPVPEVNRAGLYMSLDDARVLLDAPSGPGGLVTEVDVAMPRASSLNAAIAQGNAAAVKLRAALPAERVDPIGSLAESYLALRNAKASYSLIPIIIVLIISAVGIVNTILMSVYSRIREIGVLRAYGMTARDIRRLFTLEGLALGLAGSCLGVAFGAFLDFVLIAGGIDMAAFSMGSLPISGILRGEWNPKTMLIGFIFGVVVSLIAARIPARRAGRLEPTAALRFQ